MSLPIAIGTGHKGFPLLSGLGVRLSAEHSVQYLLNFRLSDATKSLQFRKSNYLSAVFLKSIYILFIIINSVRVNNCIRK